MDIRRIDLTARSLERSLWTRIPLRARRALVITAFLGPILGIAIILLPGSSSAGTGSALAPRQQNTSYTIRHPDPATTTTTAPPAPAPAVRTPTPTPAPPTPPQANVDSANAAAWAASPGVACIREHESGDDYGTDTGNGYYGAYQDLQSTWEAAGGTGLPSDAAPAIQDQINYRIWLMGGWGQWSTAPGCGL